MVRLHQKKISQLQFQLEKFIQCDGVTVDDCFNKDLIVFAQKHQTNMASDEELFSSIF